MADSLNLGRDGLLAIAAFRYCLGRRTYITHDCAEWLCENWAQFPANVRAVIKRDLDYAFKDDDAARESGDTFKPMGDDCDRAAWESVRSLWAEGEPRASR